MMCQQALAENVQTVCDKLLGALGTGGICYKPLPQAGCMEPVLAWQLYDTLQLLRLLAHDALLSRLQQHADRRHDLLQYGLCHAARATIADA